MSGKYDKINNYNLSYENLLDAVAEYEGFLVGLSNNDLFLFDDSDTVGGAYSDIRSELEAEAQKELGLNNFIKNVASRILDRTTGTYFFDDMFNGRMQDTYFKNLGGFQTPAEQTSVTVAASSAEARRTYDDFVEVEDSLSDYLHLIPPTPHAFDVFEDNKFTGCVPKITSFLLDDKNEFILDNSGSVIDYPRNGNMRGAIKYFNSNKLNKMPLFNASNEPVYKEVAGAKVHKEYYSSIAFKKSDHAIPDINTERIGDRFKKPTLAGIVIRHPKASLMSRNKSHLPIFFNAINPIEMSRCTPYIDIRIVTQDFISKVDTNFGDMSQVKFMRFTKNTNEDKFELDDAIGLGRTSPVNNAMTPGEIKLDQQNFNYSYMDIFNTPQTFSNADINKDQKISRKNNNDPILEPISPFLTLSSLNVSITGAGFGLMSSKKADMSLILHDRSRLRDLAPLVSSSQFATTKIIVEYGWSHPEGGVNSDNTIGKYLDALKDRSIFQVVGSNFGFGDGNTVKIDVELAAYGFRQNERVHCGAGPEVPINMIEEYIQKAADELLKQKQKEIKNGSYSDKEAPQVLQKIKLNSRSARSTDAMISWPAYQKIAGSLLKKGEPRELINIIKKILDLPIDKNNPPTFTEPNDLNSIIYRELESESAIARIFGKLEDIRTDISEDPFLKSTVTKGISYTPKDFVNQQAKQKQASLGKILSHFVGHPLAATCLYDEVQLVFYPMNHHSGGARIHTTASFPIPVDILYDKVVEKLKTNSHLSVKSFVALLEKIIRDKNLPVYGLADLYTDENNLRSKNVKDKLDILLSKFVNKKIEGLGLDEENEVDKKLFDLLSSAKDDTDFNQEEFNEILTNKVENERINNEIRQVQTVFSETKGALQADENATFEVSEFTSDDTTVASNKSTLSKSEAVSRHQNSVDDLNRLTKEQEAANALFNRYKLLLKEVTREKAELRSSGVTERCQEIYDNDNLKNAAPAEGKFVRPNIALDYEVIDVIDPPKEYEANAAPVEGAGDEDKTADGLKTNKQILRVHIYDEESVMDPAQFALLSTLIEGSSKVIGGQNFEKINGYVSKLNFNDMKQFVKRAYPTIIYGAANSTIKNVSVQSNTSGDLAQVLMVEAYGNQKNGQVQGFNYENEFESITMFPNTVTLSMMGQPMIGRGNNIFIDFGTNTSVDNIYTVKTVSHTLSAGEFSTTVTVVPSNMGSISTFKKKLSDTIEKLDPNPPPEEPKP